MPPATFARADALFDPAPCVRAYPLTLPRDHRWAARAPTGPYASAAPKPIVAENEAARHYANSPVCLFYAGCGRLPADIAAARGSVRDKCDRAAGMALTIQIVAMRSHAADGARHPVIAEALVRPATARTMEALVRLVCLSRANRDRSSLVAARNQRRRRCRAAGPAMPPQDVRFARRVSPLTIAGQTVGMGACSSAWARR